MNVEEFVEEYSGAPYDLFEVADAACALVGEPSELTDAAVMLLSARTRFVEVLGEIGYELG